MPKSAARAIAVLAAVGVAVLAGLIVGSGGDTYTLHAYVASVNGLVNTGNVEVAGFKVGEITGLSVRIGAYPEVTMQVSDSFRVRQGVHAAVELGSLAGQLNRYVELTGGTGRVLPNGTTIPERDTTVPVEIDQFLSVLTPTVRAQLRTLLRDSVHLLNGRGADIAQALRYSSRAFGQSAALFGDVASQGSALRELVTRAASGAEQLASEPAAVSSTVDRLSLLLTTAAARQRALAQSLQRMPAAFGASRTALTALAAAVPTFTRLIDAAPPALQATRPFAAALATTAPRAIPLFTSAERLVAAFRRAGPEIHALFGAPLPTTFANLRAGVTGLGPLLDQLRARAPDVLGWIPLLGDATASYNINGHGAAIVPYIRPAPQQPITPPSCLPGWLLRPFDRLPGELGCDAWTDYTESFVDGGRPDGNYLTAAQQAPWPGEFK
ncbi:MAG TPA: MlaD family protein [Solirubrobacteraceae bacterium]|jgi:phospholipid/cholesterol/gamma-HCH transport system substrate-binding protein|nr:MlaD family protein [Solirubrobacteraceae bacterium]